MVSVPAWGCVAIARYCGAMMRLLSYVVIASFDRIEVYLELTDLPLFSARTSGKQGPELALKEPVRAQSCSSHTPIGQILPSKQAALNL